MSRGRRDAGEQTAASDRDDDRVEIGHLLEDLGHQGARAGGDERMVVGVRGQRTGGLDEFLACGGRLGEFGTDQLHSRTIRSQPFDLHARRGGRQEHGRRYTGGTCRPCAGESGVAARCDRHSRLGEGAFGKVSLDEVLRTAGLERAGVLHELEGEDYSVVPLLGDRDRTDLPGDPGRRGFDVGIREGSRVRVVWQGHLISLCESC